MFFDNKFVISLIKNGLHSSKGKHNDLSYCYIQDRAEREEIKVDFIPSIKMEVNPMTKGSTLDKYGVHVVAMGLRET